VEKSMKKRSSIRRKEKERRRAKRSKDDGMLRYLFTDYTTIQL